MPRVTVVIPTYNRRDCLIDTVRSVLNQTYRDMEILVVDDGSTDDSAVEVLRQLGPDPERAEALWRQHSACGTGSRGFGFWTNDVPLQYIMQPNRGLGAARNRGLAGAHGEMVAFLEPDCLWEPHHLEHHLDYFDAHPDVWITHGRVVYGRLPSRAPKRRPRGGCLSFEEVVAGGENCASAFVARRACLEWHGGFDENLPACEDYDLWVRIAAHVPIHSVIDATVLVRRVPPAPSWSLDRYRVYALEKAYQSGHLTSDQRQRVAEELVARCDVLVGGYRQRNNAERANFYDRKRKKFEAEVTKLAGSASRSRTALALAEEEEEEEDDFSSAHA